MNQVDGAPPLVRPRGTREDGDAAPPAAEPADPLDRPATDADVLHCYELLLGREPENGFVLREAGRHSLRTVMAGFLDSGEFRTRVLPPLRLGEPTPQEQGPILPTARHRDWLGRVLRLPPQARAALAEAGWPELLRAVLAAFGQAAPGDAEGLAATLARVEEKLRQVRRHLAARG